MQDKSDPVLEQCLSDAFRRFDATLEAALPRTTPHIRQYLRGVPTKPEHVFGVRNFPHFLLPYWFSPDAERAADAEFQADLLCSSINGYYAIRICDNIADDDCPPQLRKLAPCTLYFDSEAIRPYRKYFPATHDFWTLLDTFVAQQAEASAADSMLEDVDAEIFASLSSRKFTGTKIPMAAVRYRYARLERSFEHWLRFVDDLGNFAQFNNDFFDWRHDSMRGIVTYVSSEARRQARGESTATWFFREGFEWGIAELKDRFDNVKVIAEELGHEAVLDWLIARGRALDADIDEVRSGVELLRSMESVMRSTRR
jgi:hypothetical protein